MFNISDFGDMQYISRCNKEIHIFIIWGTDLCKLWADVKKGFDFLLTFFIKYVWVLPLKDEKGKMITKPFPKTARESNHQSLYTFFTSWTTSVFVVVVVVVFLVE